MDDLHDGIRAAIDARVLELQDWFEAWQHQRDMHDALQLASILQAWGYKMEEKWPN